MGNRLLQQTKEFIKERINSKNRDSIEQEDIEKVKSAIASAFSNSTAIEQERLNEYQKDFDALNIE